MTFFCEQSLGSVVHIGHVRILIRIILNPSQVFLIWALKIEFQNDKFIYNTFIRAFCFYLLKFIRVRWVQLFWKNKFKKKKKTKRCFLKKHYPFPFLRKLLFSLKFKNKRHFWDLDTIIIIKAFWFYFLSFTSKNKNLITVYLL